MNSEDALSKTTIIVIAVSIMLIIAAVAVVMFTTSTPDKVPHMNATVEAAGNVIYLYHDGGDPFPKDRLLIRVNGEDIPPDSYTLLHSQEWPWTAGKTVKVQYNGNGNPGSVQVVYKNGNKQTVVLSQQLQSAAVIPISTVISITPTKPLTTATPAGITPIDVIATHSTTVPGETVPPGIVTTPVYPVITPGPTVSGPAESSPPRAEFIGQPVTGPAPLVVHFTDLSSGIPTSWNWNFGDGATSTEQNPVHSYATHGTYPVSLVASNGFGADKRVKEGYISTGGAPVAVFSASPRSGDSPLEVHFTDGSTGQPAAWLWDFGDGSTSGLQNPTHTYSSGGSYPVSLTVANTFGSNTRIQSGYITAGTAPAHDIYLVGSAYGYLDPNGYISFQVTDSNSWIKISGRIYQFSPGDSVQLIIDDPSSGFIDASASSITAFNFNSVRMYVNSSQVAQGIVSDMGVTGYNNYRSSTTLTIPAGDSGAVLFADGNKIVPRPGQIIIIKNFKPDADGKMTFTKKLFEVNYKGGAESYQIT